MCKSFSHELMIKFMFVTLFCLYIGFNLDSYLVMEHLEQWDIKVIEYNSSILKLLLNLSNWKTEKHVQKLGSPKSKQPTSQVHPQLAHTYQIYSVSAQQSFTIALVQKWLRKTFHKHSLAFNIYFTSKYDPQYLQKFIYPMLMLVTLLDHLHYFSVLLSPILNAEQ